MELPATVARAEYEQTLDEVLFIAQAWSEALYSALDQPSRVNLAKASRQCQEWVQQTAQQATATLITFGGQPEAIWQRGLAGVERGLRARQGRANRLVVRVQTPNPAALQSLLAIAGPAGTAATELEMQQVSSLTASGQALSTAWLTGLPAAFPNIRVLTLSGLRGKLPPPAQLPHLRELTVRLHRGYGTGVQPAGSCSLQRVVRSTAAYTPQLTALSIKSPVSDFPWPQLLSRTSYTLERLDINYISDECLRLLRTRAPNLVRLTCPDCELDDISEQIQVKEFAFSGADMYLFPDTVGQVTFLPEAREGELFLNFAVYDEYGLEPDVQQRMQQWRCAVPAHVMLELPTYDADDPTDLELLQTEVPRGIQAAVQQLSTLLPPSSTISVEPVSTNCDRIRTEAAAAALPAVAAAAAAHPQYTILPLAVDGDEWYMGHLCAQTPPIPHARLWKVSYRLSYAYADVAWPWPRLTLHQLSLQDLLKLPDPTGGQYEVTVTSQSHLAHEHISKLTPDMLARVEQRLQHLAIIIPARKYDPCTITLVAGKGMDVSMQPQAIRELLRLLGLLRWRRECQGVLFNVCLDGWALTPALTHELRALPCVEGPSRLTLHGQDCVSDPSCDLSSLVSSVPACFSTYIVEQGTVEDVCFVHELTQLCLGAAELSLGRERLALCVRYQSKLLSDTERSIVEACFDEHELDQ